MFNFCFGEETVPWIAFSTIAFFVVVFVIIKSCLDKKSEATKKELVTAKQAQISLSNELSSTQTDLIASVEKCCQLEKSCNELKKQLDRTENTCAILRKQIHETSSLADEAESRRSDFYRIKRDLEWANINCTELREKNFALTRELSEKEAISSNLENAQRNYDVLQEQVSSLKDSLNQMRSVADKAKEQKIELQEQVSFLKDRLNQMASAADEAKKQKIELLQLREFCCASNSNLTAIPYMAKIMADYETYDLEHLASCLSWGYDQKRLKKVQSIREIRKEAQMMVKKN